MQTIIYEQRLRSLRLDRLRSLGEMAAGMAHELNQPLVGVRGLAEHLLIAQERGWPLTKKKIREKVGDIVDQADRMSHIIEHVRIFARETGKPEARPTQMNEVVRSAMSMLEMQFKSRGIEMECELSASLPLVLVNPFSLEEVILNLLLNSRDAVEEGFNTGSTSVHHQILLRSFTEEEDSRQYVKIEVIDRGVGIPVEALSKIFDPFFTTKDPDKGTGLGLPIAKAIAEQFGGSLAIQSAPGQGTKAIISLPV